MPNPRCPIVAPNPRPKLRPRGPPNLSAANVNGRGRCKLGGCYDLATAPPPALLQAGACLAPGGGPNAEGFRSAPETGYAKPRQAPDAANRPRPTVSFLLWSVAAPWREHARYEAT